MKTAAKIFGILSLVWVILTGLSIAGCGIMVMTTGVFASYIADYVNQIIREAGGSPSDVPVEQIIQAVTLVIGIMGIIVGGLSILVGGLVSGIHLKRLAVAKSRREMMATSIAGFILTNVFGLVSGILCLIMKPNHYCPEPKTPEIEKKEETKE